MSIRTGNVRLLKAEGKLAKDLKATGLWDRQIRKGGVAKRQVGDRSRVHIVSKPLCDDIISYLGPTLKRHQGCDLISMYPGAGAFTKALHNALKPRAHILMEPDEDMYKPFLEELLELDGVQLIPKSGVVWNELNEVLSPEYLPHQVERDPKTAGPAQRNDTLLVSANLGMYPARKFLSFDSISRMVIYQFITAIRNSSLVQKYGNVRILLWINHDERAQIIPRVLQQRKRLAIQAELATDYVAEVAGPDNQAAGEEVDDVIAALEKRGFYRDHHIDLESVRRTLVRMKEQGIETPKGRESEMIREFKKLGIKLGQALPVGLEAAHLNKPYLRELKALEIEHAKEAFPVKSAKWKRLYNLQRYLGWHERRHTKCRDFMIEMEAISDMYDAAATSGSPEDMETAKAREVELNDRVQKLDKNMKHELILAWDQVRVFKQGGDKDSEPILSWDRRPYEPLPVKATDFFPNHRLALIDIQPKASDEIFKRQYAIDTLDMLLSGIMNHSGAGDIGSTIETIFPGAKDGVIPNCPSLRDRSVGGTPLTGFGAMNARSMNQTHILELLNAWMSWPFRPTFSELVNRTSDDDVANDEHGGLDILADSTATSGEFDFL